MVKEKGSILSLFLQLFKFTWDCTLCCCDSLWPGNLTVKQHEPETICSIMQINTEWLKGPDGVNQESLTHLSGTQAIYRS